MIPFIIAKIECQNARNQPIVAIVIVVASASVDQKMDLNEITRKFLDAEYHPD